MRPAAAFDAALVDLDGTMVDTLGDFVAALDLMLNELGLAPAKPDAVVRLIGKGGEHLVRSTLAAAGKSLEAVEEMGATALARYREHYHRVNGRHSTVFPGVEEGLARLRDAGLKLACVTNKPTDASCALLRLKSLDRYFDIVAGGDKFERLKPDPMPLLGTCEALGSAPARTLMIGDSMNDALAARAAGCPVVLVTYGFNHGKPAIEVDADAYVDSMASIRLA